MSRALDVLTDACVGLSVTVRRMFGGHGCFAPNGGMFAAVVTDDEVILKLVRGPARDELLALGGRSWMYAGGGRATTMAEWIVIPEAFYDDQEQLAAWCRRAHGLAPAKVAKVAKVVKRVKGEKAATVAKAAKPRPAKEPRARAAPKRSPRSSKRAGR
jgi:TfoX/Sxy family transcriptional regulator of competence genes